jgi:fructose-bisphosphate aldolase class II
MIDAARSGGYAYPAVNVSSSETLNAAVRGFSAARSDGIVQITTGAAAYLSGSSDDMAVGARAFAEFAHTLVARAPVFIALHTDHCTPENVDGFLRPLLRASRLRRRRGGEALFNSHMFDGSHLPLRENLRLSAELLQETHELGLVLELEIGLVGGEEDGLDNARFPPERRYSTPADAVAVADALGLGERGRYLLAATFGNSHGRSGVGETTLRPELLADLQRAATCGRGGGRLDFVFHGASGSGSEDIRVAIANGVVKVNVDTDMQYAFTRAVETHFRYRPIVGRVSQAPVDKRVYDPRAWGRKAELNMATRIVEICRELGSANRSTVNGRQSRGRQRGRVARTHAYAPGTRRVPRGLRGS